MQASGTPDVLHHSAEPELFYSWLLGHSFFIWRFSRFYSCPRFYICPPCPLTKAFKMAALKRLKQLKYLSIVTG